MTGDGVTGGLDRRAVGAGALVALALLVPVVIVVSALDESSPAWVFAVVALFAAFIGAGGVAARRAPDRPLVHAAAAALAAVAVIVALNLVLALLGEDGLSLATVVTLAIYGQIGVALAILGGWGSARRRGRGRAHARSSGAS